MKYRKNKRERAFQQSAITKGWEVLQSGWPDFLLYKEATNEAILVEIKVKPNNKSKDCLGSNQRRMIEVLRNLGLKVEVIYKK